MGLLRRRPRGRHALGAAVTALPSAPLSWEPPAAAEPVDARPAGLVDEIAQLIATGEAWRDALPSVVQPTAEPVDAPVQEAAPPVAPVPRPTQPVCASLPAQTGPLVHLGFRDGSAASLDPESDAAQALAELSDLLTRRE